VVRIAIFNVPHHITQRGNARQFLLASDDERLVYLNLLRKYAQLYALELLGYCLMSNHVHLVVVPRQADSLAQALKQHTADSTASAGPWDPLGPSVAADGSIFQVISTRDLTTDWCSPVPSTFTLKMYLSKMAPDGSTTFTLFNTESSLVHDDYPYWRYVAHPTCLTCDPVGVYPPNQLPPFNQFFRVVPDGQGGAFVPWWRDLGYPNYEAHLTHISGSAVSDTILPLTYQNTALQNGGSCPFPYFRPGISCIADFRLVLGENGVLFATDLKSVIAIDTATMSPLWTHSTGSGMDLVAATADGGVTINDFQLGLVALDANGQVGTPSRQTSTAMPWALGYWMGDLGGAFGEFVGPSTAISSSAWPFAQGDAEEQSRSPKLRIATFIPSIPGLPGSPLGSEAGARNHVQDNISSKTVDNRLYTLTIKPPFATIRSFADESRNAVDALGFIGHANLALGDSGTAFAVGLNFLDNALIRTPDCTPSGNLLGLCYYLDKPTPERPQAHTTPPCVPPAVPVVSYDGTETGCYLLTQLNGFVAETTRRVLTSANIIFAAACDTGQAFTGWWEMNLNTLPGGRALVVPDIAGMSALPANQGLNTSVGAIDLQQGAIGWEAFVTSLASGGTVEEAKNAANDAIALKYPTFVWPADSVKLAQVVFTVVGNHNVCPKCNPAQ
jgi:Transposase IS200 like